MAAGAFIGEHSFSRKGMPIAEGRPDESDLKQATEFGKKDYRGAGEGFLRGMLVRLGGER